MASNTPNLDLLKKDPATDGNDAFNIETMLNENWDKIDASVGQLERDMQEIDIPLSDETNGTRSNVAGSEKAVGDVMKEAQAAKTLGNERKQQAVDALIAWGVSASMADSWDTIFFKMTAIIKATGNATAADVLTGKTFSNANGNGLQGAMPNRGSGGAITPSTSNQTKLAGYYSSDITVLGDSNLKSENIAAGKSIFGVVGNVTKVAVAPGDEVFIVAPLTDPSGYGYDTTTNTTLTKMRELRINVTGTVRISFRVGTSGGTAVFRIYKNGQPFGTPRTHAGSSRTTYTEDLAVSAGDLIQFYLVSLTYSTAYLYHFHVCLADNPFADFIL